MSKFNVGDKVRYINTNHDTNLDYYPPYGTIGVFKGNDWVQWPIGATSGDGCWCCDESDIELVVEDMTNEEIWEMLLPKMRKNGLEIAGYLQDYTGEVGCYDEDDVHNAIAIAYRSGYERAMKGRPFKIGEKKKKGGHWEPVDPNNLPEEGTKVRYSRECKNYKNCENEIIIGDTGVVKLEGPKHDWFGIKLDNHRNLYYNWLSFDGITASCLDMWVEDNE